MARLVVVRHEIGQLTIPISEAGWGGEGYSQSGMRDEGDGGADLPQIWHSPALPKSLSPPQNCSFPYLQQNLEPFKANLVLGLSKRRKYGKSKTP